MFNLIYIFRAWIFKKSGSESRSTAYLDIVHVMANSLKYHKCDSCDKSFRKNKELERHLHTVHDGYKAHKCDYCDKSFLDAETLKKHTSSQFMKDTKIINVNIVANHFLIKEIAQLTEIRYMEDQGHSNVMFVKKNLYLVVQ